MSVDKLKKVLKEKKFTNLYLLYGEEDYLVRYYKKALMKAILGDNPGMNLVTFEGDGIEIKELVRSANTLPFFSPYRVILIENSNLFTTKNELSEELKTLPPSTILIFAESKVDRKMKLFKALKDKGLIIEFQRETPDKLAKWAMAFCSNSQVSLSKIDADYLILRVGNHMDLLYLEMEKLISYAYEKKEITKDDIDFICPETIEDKTFKLIDSIGKKDRQSALNYYYDLVDLREPMLRVLFLITKNFRILLTAKKLQKEGNPYELAGLLGLHPYVAKNYLMMAEKFSLTFLTSAFDYSLSIDKDIKTGVIQENPAIEKIILAYTKK